MDDITSFIAARLAAVERVARAATQGTWHDCGGTVALATSGLNEITEYVFQQADIHHIVMHHPAAVLRDIEATRLLIALHRGDWPHDPDDGPGEYSWTERCQRCHEVAPCETVRLVASRWSTHPNYRPEWAPAPEED